MLIYFNDFVDQIKRRKRDLIGKKEVSGSPPLVVVPGRPPLPPPIPPPLSPRHVMSRISL